jgi:hypothetical protein
METSNRTDSNLMQRIMVLAVIAVLAVVAAYLWGNRLSAGSDLSLSQAPQYATFRGVAAIRAADTSAADTSANTSGASYAARIRQHEARGGAAVRAVDASAGPGFAGLQGVAAVRAADEGYGR